MSQKGFTLIELMIVFLILGILTMFALPAYQDYNKRVYIAEGLSFATTAKLAVTEQFVTQGIWAANNDEAGITLAGNITGQSVAAISVITDTAAKGFGQADSYDITSPVSNVVISYNARVTGNVNDNVLTSDATVTDDNALVIAPIVLSQVEKQGSVAWVCKAKGAKILDKSLPSECLAQIKNQ